MFVFGVGNHFATKSNFEKRGWKQDNNLEPLNRFLLCIFISFGVRWSWFYISNCAAGTYTKLSPEENEIIFLLDEVSLALIIRCRALADKVGSEIILRFTRSGNLQL